MIGTVSIVLSTLPSVLVRDLATDTDPLLVLFSNLAEQLIDTFGGVERIVEVEAEFGNEAEGDVPGELVADFRGARIESFDQDCGVDGVAPDADIGARNAKVGGHANRDNGDDPVQVLRWSSLKLCAEGLADHRADPFCAYGHNGSLAIDHPRGADGHQA